MKNLIYWLGLYGKQPTLSGKTFNNEPVNGTRNNIENSGLLSSSQIKTKSTSLIRDFIILTAFLFASIGSAAATHKDMASTEKYTGTLFTEIGPIHSVLSDRTFQTTVDGSTDPAFFKTSPNTTDTLSSPVIGSFIVDTRPLCLSVSGNVAISWHRILNTTPAGAMGDLLVSYDVDGGNAPLADTGVLRNMTQLDGITEIPGNHCQQADVNYLVEANGSLLPGSIPRVGSGLKLKDGVAP